MKSNGINVLSLFDGISCGQVALERAGIKVNNYYASEIDKYAIKVTQKNYPDTIQLGDITKVKAIDLPKIDLVMGGSPCQGFSFAGKQLNFNDPRSALFFEFARLVKECQPKYFLLENVKMKKEYQNVISELLGVQPIEINSALVSAQNRKRLYWANIPNITQPEDKRIYLKDIIEDNIYTQELFTNKPLRLLTYGKGGQGQRVYGLEGKSVSLSALGGGWGAKTGLYLIVPEATKKQYCVIKNNNCVDLTFINSKTRRGRSMEFKANCLTATNFKYVLFRDGFIRDLSVSECEALQTIPRGYTSSITENQAKKALGNGWTVDVICHILKGVRNEEKED